MTIKLSMKVKLLVLLTLSIKSFSVQAQDTMPNDTSYIYKEHNLDEIVVTRQTPLVKLKTDKVTYRVADDADSKTRSVLEMLRKIPMVIVDGRNNITVNGSSQFKVYVDGRLNTTITRNPSKMLRNMPANNIKSIEVITNPGAQYDAEGAGGILCIFTKKESGQKTTMHDNDEMMPDFNASAHATVSTKSLGFDASLSQQINRWSWDLNVSYEYWRSPGAYSESEITGNGTRQFSSLTSVSKMPGTMGDFSIGYDIDSVRSVHANVSLNRFSMKDNGSPSYNYSGGIWGNNLRFSGNQLSKMTDTGIEGSVDYQRLWGQHGRFFLNYQINYTPSINESENKFTDIPSPTPEMQMILRDNRSEVHEHTFSNILMCDVTIPLSASNLLNTGVKLNAEVSKSDAKEEMSEHDEFAELHDANVCFRQNQYIAALYTEWQTKWNIISMKNGLRYEHTWQRSKYLKGNGSSFSLNYGSLVPSVNIDANICSTSSLGFNYSMRIRRPQINELDPFVNRSDPSMLSYGNPKLDAQNLHHMAVIYTLSSGKASMRFSFDHAWSNNGISQYTILKNERLHSTYGNILKDRTTSLNTYTTCSLSDATRLSLNGQMSYRDVRSDVLNERNHGWHANANFGIQQRLPWQIKSSANIEWMSRQHTLQGYTSSMSMLSVSLNRSFLNDKCAVALSATTGLGHGGKMVWKSVSSTKDFSYTTKFVDSMQDITLGITYNIGSTKANKHNDTSLPHSFNMNSDGDSQHIKMHRVRK